MHLLQALSEREKKKKQNINDDIEALKSRKNCANDIPSSDT
jgi:hypothetical protein